MRAAPDDRIRADEGARVSKTDSWMLVPDAPLVLAVDDVHWFDEPSLRYLAYLVRRLDGLGAAMGA
jgi:hypothetical protein